MNPKEMLAHVLKETLDFLHWFAHSRAAIILTIILSLPLPVFVFYQVAVVPASSCERDFSSGDTTDLEVPGVDSDSTEALLPLIQDIRDLELEKAYLTSLLELSSQDSAYLNLNITDSLLLLEIKGVPVRECALEEIRVTRQLRCLNQSQLLAWVSSPFRGQEDLSTIPKIRYVVKEAPKDTNEAAQLSDKPIPPDSSSVFFTIYFDRDLAIEIEQSDEPFDGEEKVIRDYQKNRQRAIRYKTMQALLHFTSPEPEILIRLKVSKADARAIYRGLPVHPGLALRLQ